jgi:hypothetical protein
MGEGDWYDPRDGTGTDPMSALMIVILRRNNRGIPFDFC